MWRVFVFAFVRKVGYLVAAALFGLLLARESHAQTGCFVWNGTGSPDGNLGSSSSCNTIAQEALAVFGPAHPAFTSPSAVGTGTAGDTPTASGQTCSVVISSQGSIVQSFGQADQAGSCPVACAAPSGQASYMALSSFVNPGATVCASDGCTYQGLPSNAVREGLVKADPTVLQVMSSLGTACTSSASAPTSAATVSSGKDSSACTSGGGNTLCIQTSAAGLASEVVNGSTVLPSFMKPSTCLTLSGGGMACQAPTGSSTTPAALAPDSVTAGTPDAPISTIQEGAATINVYSAGQVAGSHHSLITGSGSATGGGAGAGTGTGGTSGTCTPSAPGVTPVVTCGASGSSTEGGGLDCLNPPTCTGDAIQCGVVQQIWLDRCANTDPADIAAGALGDGGGMAVGSDSLDQSTVLSETGPVVGNAGACPAPIAITFMGRTIQLDLWAFLCRWAGMVSSVIMAVAYFAAARIWIGSLIA
jgi:hypothetical protein